jgi:hypothetical protein
VLGVAANETEACLALLFARIRTEPVVLKEEPLEVQALSPDSVLAVGGAPCEFYALLAIGPGRLPIRKSRCSKEYKILL